VANTNAHIYARKNAHSYQDDRVGRISLECIQKLENEDSEQHLPYVVASTAILEGFYCN